MDTVVINVKVNRDLKTQAQNIAQELGFSLSALVNACLKQIIRTRTVSFSAVEEPSDYLLKVLKESKKDIKTGCVSPTFKNAKTAVKWLNSPRKKYVGKI